MKILDDQDSGDDVNREPLPDRHRGGLTVEAGQEKEGIGKTREAADSGTSS